MKKKTLFILVLGASVFSINISYSQASVPGYTDPAINRNKLIRDQLGEGTYKQIGVYKVIGTSYLFGERHNGDVFTSKEKAYNISINYNTYNQEIEFFSSSNPNTPLAKSTGEVDSFVLKQDIAKGINEDLKFVYAPLAGGTEKAYLQVIYSGKRFSLYKRYKSDLGIVSTNYVQSELRQFDLIADYFYYDSETKKFKKLKWNMSNLIKEFKTTKDITPVANNEEFSVNPELTAKKVFEYLNS